MKKLFLLAACVALAALTVACAANAAPSSQPDPAPSSQPETVPESNTSTGPAPTVQEDKLTVADAAMYRGTVTAVLQENGTLLVTLTQAEGTDFGAPALQFRITNDTRISFPADQLGDGLTGQYLEVYYGRPLEETAPATDRAYDAVAVNHLGQADMVLTNGTIAEIAPHPDKPGEGYLLVDPILPAAQAPASTPAADSSAADTAPMQIAFLYGPESQFYLDFDSLKVGDQLSIFHSPAMTMSLPPQCFGLEYRPYQAAK